MLIAADELTLVILAGGKAQRLGGKQKGLLPVQGKPMIQHLTEKFHNKVARLIINANADSDRYLNFADAVVADTLDDFQGPLAGILAGMQNAETCYMLVLPCDVPMVPGDVISMLSTAMQQDTDVAVVSLQHRLQPVCLLLRTDLVQNLQTALSQGTRKAEDWVRSLRFVQVDDTNREQCYMNVNTADDLQHVESMLHDAVSKKETGNA